MTTAHTQTPLGSYAVKRCPKRVALDYDPTMADIPTQPPTPAQQERMDAGIAFEEAVQHLLTTANPHTVVIESFPHPTASQQLQRSDATVAAMANGAELVWNPRLPHDVTGRRVGEPDLLIRGPKRRDGKWSYRPVDVKWHAARPGKGTTTALVSSLDKPRYAAARTVHNVAKGRLDDELQLAHYVRMLDACGFAVDAKGPTLAAILGRDGALWWTDLDAPNRRLNDGAGSRAASVMEVYDHEFAIRLDIVDRAQARALGDPPVVGLCPRWSQCKTSCPWRDYCYQELVDADSLILLTRVTQRQADQLAAVGITTRTELAALDDSDIAAYQQSSGVPNLERHVLSARAAVSGTLIPRPSFDWFPNPDTTDWIDVDMENDPDTGIVYLWGVRDAAGYHSFMDLTGSEEGERDTFVAFWNWLQDRTSTGAVAYCYTSAEERCLRHLATKHAGHPGVPTLGDIDRFVRSPQWYDLYRFVNQIAWPTESLSIKQVAGACGFTWRDSNPSGEESVLWYREASGGPAVPEPVRLAATRRLLDYNEDDVRAMDAIRTYTRSVLGHLVPHAA